MLKKIEQLRRVAAVAALLLTMPISAQIVSSNHGTQLAPISDAATVAAKLRPIPYGETSIDFAALNPNQRAELIRLLADVAPELTLRAWNGQGDSGAADGLVIDQQRVPVDTRNSNGIWWFEYVNTGRSAIRARWQLSRLPFPTDLKDWRSPAGLVSQGELKDVLRGSQANRFQLQIGSFLIGANREKLELVHAPGQTVTSMLHTEYPAAQLYLRVIVIGRSGTPVARPSNSVLIQVQPSAVGNDSPQPYATLSQAPEWVAASTAAIDQRCWYQVTRDVEVPAPDVLGQAQQGPRKLAYGDRVNACIPEPEGLLGNFERHQGSAMQVTEALTTWDNERFKNAMELAFTAMQREFGGPAGGCNSHCQQALTLTLELGSAVLGVPSGNTYPDPYLQEGSDYLRLLMRDAFVNTDFPESVHELAAEKALKVFRDAMFSPSLATPPPFQPDPAHSQSAPRLRLFLTGGSAGSPATYLQVRETGKSARLRSALIPIPALSAGQQLIIPVQMPLEQDLDSGAWGLPPVPQLTAGLSDAAALLTRVAQRLSDAGKLQARTSKAVSRGRYELELAWRTESGEFVRAARVRCSASGGICKQMR